MTEKRRTALKELQDLDLRILEAQQRIRDFDPRFIEVEESALVLESEAERTRTRLKEMKSFWKTHEKESERALEDLKQAALRGENIFARLMETVRLCSLGQITHALYQVGGRYRRNM